MSTLNVISCLVILFLNRASVIFLKWVMKARKEIAELISIFDKARAIKHTSIVTLIGSS
jgi:hypothetical protein